ncbi:MAG: hypothetical protein M3Y93_04000 [Pseudomonadota bacterium]|nr:hypothetical protein [Pseudomonadota bacterium]
MSFSVSIKVRAATGLRLVSKFYPVHVKWMHRARLSCVVSLGKLRIHLGKKERRHGDHCGNDAQTAALVRAFEHAGATSVAQARSN